MKKDRKLIKPPMSASIAVVLIFAIDLLIPLGVAVGVLYVSCILIVVKEHKKTIFLFAFVCSALTAIIPIITLTPATTWMAFVNRGISILAIWIVAFIASRQNILEEKLMHLDEIERKNRELELFAYMASHDLQEPLRTVGGFVKRLEKKYTGKLDEKADKYLFYIAQATDRMSDLITGLLSYSRLGNELQISDIDCNQIIKDIQDDMGAMIIESKATIHINNLPRLRGYELKFRLLLQNLINNAIKFRKTGTDPVISISAIYENNQWKFAVKDNGIGIDPESHDKIFLVFQRLHPRNQYDGHGIGLAHCRKIVELHGGNIWVESQPGKGSTFYFTIPS
jgi:light-regulated signal transduction histidine kinase (bacteriophytochrome)